MPCFYDLNSDKSDKSSSPADTESEASISFYIFAILIFLVFVAWIGWQVVDGLKNTQFKPIWTEEGWLTYKESLLDFPLEILHIILWGVIPSALGFATIYFFRKRYSQKAFLRNLVLAFAPIAATVLVVTYFWIGRCWWGFLGIASFFAGLMGVIILPDEAKRQDK